MRPLVIDLCAVHIYVESPDRLQNWRSDLRL